MLCLLQRTRDVMKAAGLPTPKNMAVKTPEDLEEAAKVVGFPAVLKPTSGAASVGVIKIDSLGDLDRRVYSPSTSLLQAARPAAFSARVASLALLPF